MTTAQDLSPVAPVLPLPVLDDPVWTCGDASANRYLPQHHTEEYSPTPPIEHQMFSLQIANFQDYYNNQHPAHDIVGQAIQDANIDEIHSSAVEPTLPHMPELMESYNYWYEIFLIKKTFIFLK